MMAGGILEVPPQASISLGVMQGITSFSRMASGAVLVPDALERDLTAWITALSFGGWLPSGTSLYAELPFGAVALSDRFDGRAHAGLGDTTLGARQDVAPWLFGSTGGALRLTLGLSATFPTGKVVQTDALADSNLEKAKAIGVVTPQGTAFGSPVVAAEVFNLAASLGRGAWWGAADVAVMWRALPWLGLSAQTQVRGVLSDGRSQVSWGTEVLTGGVAQVAIPGANWLQLRAGLQHEWRGRAHESGSVLVESSGGHWLFAAPGVTLSSESGVSLTMDARLPVWRHVHGFQLVETWTVSAGLLLRFGVGEPQHQPPIPQDSAPADDLVMH